MTATKPLEHIGFRQKTPGLSGIGPHAVLGGALVAALAVVLRIAPDSHESAAPALSALFFALAALVAVLAWRRPRRGPRLTYWDVAGALTLIGAFIAASVEPEQMVQLISAADRKP